MTQSVNERLNNASAVVGALIKETKALKAGVLELQSIVAAQNTLIAKLMEQANKPRRATKQQRKYCEEILATPTDD